MSSKHKKRIRPPTPESMAKTALAYLGRYAASEMALRRVLENRIRRAIIHNPEFGQDHDALASLRDAIEKLIEKHRKTGALNDAAYAETKVVSLRRAGRSAHAITQKLGHAGVKKSLIKTALEGDGDEDPATSERKAAITLARRRKLGRFGAHADDSIRYRKDLAVMARAGFSLALARDVLGGHFESEEDESGDFA